MKKKIILTIFAVAAAVFAILAVRDYLREKNAGQELAELREQVKTETTVTPTPTEEPEKVQEEPKPEEEVQEEKEPVEIPIDFEQLQAINPDIYAWITIPNTEVDYPILQSQSGDDDYYLHRGIDKEYDFAGCIYTQATYNKRTFTDRNTVIYGHSMKNGSMFHGIKDYANRDFFDNNKEIIIYKPDAILHYTVFAAYLADDTHILATYDMNNDEVFEQYLGWIRIQNGDLDNIDEDIEVTTDDKIITLSTCYDADSEMRYLVQAVLTEVEE
jgi:sortase B